jgi:putative ABC transport system ATP-binding protein
VNEPAVVLADEPTGNLDTDRSVEVLDMFRRFNRERAQAFVIVTHDRDVASLCDREISVRDGRLRDPAAERSVA